MAGTKTGAQKALQTIREKYGEDYFEVIGRQGGAKKVAKGFAVNRALAAEAGRKGGTISKRRPVELAEEHLAPEYKKPSLLSRVLQRS